MLNKNRKIACNRIGTVLDYNRFSKTIYMSDTYVWSE